MFARLLGLLAYGEKDILSYKHDIILAMERDSADPTKFTLFYNRFALHSLPLCLNTFANDMIEFRTPKDQYKLEMTSHPLSYVQVNESFRVGSERA